VWVRLQAANLPLMLSTLLGWRYSGVRDESEVCPPGLIRAKDLLPEGAAFSTVVAPALTATALSRASEGFTPGRSCKMPASYTPLEATVAVRLSTFFRSVSTRRLAATIVVWALLKTAKRKPRGLHLHSTD
jgi:predicted metal-binding membrane protein